MNELVVNNNGENEVSIWDQPEFPKVTKALNITPPKLLEMLDKYANYGGTILELCNEYHINTHSFYGLCRSYPAIELVYRTAQKDRAEHMAHESIAIADDDSNDMVMQESKNGTAYFTPNMANVRRADLRVRSRQYLMEKYNPDIYASRTKIEQTSSNLHIHAHTILPSVDDLESVGLEGLQDVQRSMRYGESAAQQSGACRR
jgi:hypothetical protein